MMHELSYISSSLKLVTSRESTCILSINCLKQKYWNLIQLRIFLESTKIRTKPPKKINQETNSTNQSIYPIPNLMSTLNYYNRTNETIYFRRVALHQIKKTCEIDIQSLKKRMILYIKNARQWSFTQVPINPRPFVGGD